MEPAEPIPIKLALVDSDLKGETLVLNHHSMLTPSNFKFGVLRNPSQNFQFRGMLWLTTKNLIYKGFLVEKMGASKISENLVKPFCNIDTEQPFEKKIPIETISEIFVGHDNKFQKRFQRYPKLRITFNEDSESNTFYFYLTRENLIDDELYVNKRCTEWKESIQEQKTKITGVAAVPEIPGVPSPPVPGQRVTPSLRPQAPGAKPTPAAVPTSAAAATSIGGTDKLLKDVVASSDKKRFGKVTVKPLEEREKPAFIPTVTPIEKSKEELEEEALAMNLLDTLVPISDDEFQSAQADSSVARCPHCGWIINYATSKCPRCRKTL
jgi:hypothetical protein